MQYVLIALLLITPILPVRAQISLVTAVRAPDHAVLNEKLTYELRIQTDAPSLLAVEVWINPAQTIESGVVADWSKPITRPCSFKRNRALCLVDSTSTRAASVFINAQVLGAVPAEQQALFLIRDPRGYQAEEQVKVKVQGFHTMYLPLQHTNHMSAYPAP